MKVNEGEVPQYYVEDSHPAIIPPDEWERVQKEIARRRSLGRKYSGNGIFATRIVCGECGAYYGAKVWNSNDKYRRVVWQCNDKFKGKGKDKCTTIHLSEDEIKRRFITAFNILFDSKDEVIANCEMVARLFSDTTDLDEKKDTLLQELEVVSELIQKLIDENTSQAQDQGDYMARYNAYVKRYESFNEKFKTIEQEILVRKGRADAFDDFIRVFATVEEKLLDFDDNLWVLTIDKVKVMPNGELRFVFQNGAEIIA